VRQERAALGLGVPGSSSIASGAGLGGGGSPGTPPRLCESLSCSKPRADHPNKRIIANGRGFCVLTGEKGPLTGQPGAGQQNGGGQAWQGKGGRGNKGGRGGRGGRGGGGGGRGGGRGDGGGRGGRGGGGKGGIPQHMQGHASRSLPSAAFPGGQPICFPYHAPGASQCAAGNACWMAHTCPVFLPAGGICNQNHRLQDHQ